MENKAPDRLSPFLVVLLLAAAGCGGPPEAEPLPPRAVTVLELEKTDPARSLHLTGSVASWKEEKLAFDVAGLLEMVIEPGTDVEGPRLDPEGQVVEPGTVLARLSRERYELRVAAAQAQVAATRARADAVRIEVEQVLPQELEALRAERDRAAAERERIEALVKREVGSQSALDRVVSQHRAAQARVEQMEANLAARGAERTSLLASVRQQEEAVREAELDLDHCVITAPYRGRVSRVHGLAGGYVQPGQAVVTFVVMDPITVEVTVSPDTDRAVAEGDLVTVLPPGASRPVQGWVHYKDTAADPATGTFQLHIMVRNHKVPSDIPPDSPLLALPRIHDVWPPERPDVTLPGPIVVELRTLAQDENGHHVWHATPEGPEPTVFRVHRVPVKLGPARMDLLGLYQFRELADTGGLGLEDLLACGVPPGVQDGDRVLLLRERWVFRPGDLAEVSLSGPGPGPGLYLPLEAIVTRQDRHQVLVVTPPEDVVEAVDVTVGDAVGELRRVEGEGLAPGVRVLLGGAHQAAVGERVRVVPAGREER